MAGPKFTFEPFYGPSVWARLERRCTPIKYAAIARALQTFHPVPAIRCRDDALMRPLAVLNAIIFGSAAAITFGLGGVLVIFLVLKGRYPEMGEEFPTLMRSSALFAALALVAGTSLFSLLKERRWRWLAQAAMWLVVAGIAVLYWPR